MTLDLPRPRPEEPEYPFVGSLTWRGLTIDVETRRGERRRGKGWVSPPLPAHYGEVRGTVGRDDDPVDVFVGEHPDAPKVFVIRSKFPGKKAVDETKSMLGFRTMREALAAFRGSYSMPGFYHSCTAFPADEWVERVLEPQFARGTMRKATRDPAMAGLVRVKISMVHPKTGRRFDRWQWRRPPHFKHLNRIKAIAKLADPDLSNEAIDRYFLLKDWGDVRNAMIEQHGRSRTRDVDRAIASHIAWENLRGRHIIELLDTLKTLGRPRRGYHASTLRADDDRPIRTIEMDGKSYAIINGEVMWHHPKAGWREVRNLSRKSAVREALGLETRVESTPAPPPEPEADTYRGSHQPAQYAPASDLESVQPDILAHPDWYTGFGHQLPEFWPTIVRNQGNPDAMITVYRGMPQGAGRQLERGNWVTLSRSYAEDHIDGEEGWHVVAHRVRLGDLWWAGDDLAEWGYWGAELSASDDRVPSRPRLPAAVRKQLLKREAAIRDKSEEHAHVYLPSTDQWVSITPDMTRAAGHNPRNSLHMPASLCRAMIEDGNVVLTHNHPVWSDHGGYGGTTFSAQDIVNAADTNAAEIRAVTPFGTWILRRPEGGWPTGSFVYEVRRMDREAGYKASERMADFMLAVGGDFNKVVDATLAGGGSLDSLPEDFDEPGWDRGVYTAIANAEFYAEFQYEGGFHNLAIEWEPASREWADPRRAAAGAASDRLERAQARLAAWRAEQLRKSGDRRGLIWATIEVLDKAAARFRRKRRPMSGAAKRRRAVVAKRLGPRPKYDFGDVIPWGNHFRRKAPGDKRAVWVGATREEYEEYEERQREIRRQVPIAKEDPAWKVASQVAKDLVDEYGADGANSALTEMAERVGGLERWAQSKGTTARFLTQQLEARIDLRRARDRMPGPKPIALPRPRASESRFAALYVDPKGPYGELTNEWYDQNRDARNYVGDLPIVAHPPCGPWGKLAWRCTNQDKQTGFHAVEMVRRNGGILEHPVGSRLFREAGIAADNFDDPDRDVDEHGGYTIRVPQWHWGHRGEKDTILYIVGTAHLPPLPRQDSETAKVPVQNMSKLERRLTPAAMAYWMASVAKRCEGWKELCDTFPQHSKRQILQALAESGADSPAQFLAQRRRAAEEAMEAESRSDEVYERLEREGMQDEGDLDYIEDEDMRFAERRFSVSPRIIIRKAVTASTVAPAVPESLEGVHGEDEEDEEQEMLLARLHARMKIKPQLTSPNPDV